MDLKLDLHVKDLLRTYCFLKSGLGHDWFLTNGASRRETPMKILDAMYLVRGVHREGDSVQGFIAHNTGETLILEKYQM